MDYSPHYEYIEKKDIRNSFRLPSFDELNNRMRERREDQSWPPKFPSHEGTGSEKDIRNSFRLPSFDELNNRMRERREDQSWPPKFPSHEDYDPAFPMWAGFTKEPKTKLTLTDELDSDKSSEASGNSSVSGRSKIIRGPRIIQIPILVESRDDSPCYSSDTQSSDVNKTSRQTKSRSTESSGTSQAKYHSGGTNHSTHQAQRSHSNQEFRKEPSQMPPRKSWSQPPSSPPANKVEHGIPLTVSHKTQQPVPQQQQQQQGGFVTRVAVNQSPTANNNISVPDGAGKQKENDETSQGEHRVPLTVREEVSQRKPEQKGGFVTRVAMKQSPGGKVGVPPGGRKPKEEKKGLRKCPVSLTEDVKEIRSEATQKIDDILISLDRVMAQVERLTVISSGKQYGRLNEVLWQFVGELDAVNTEDKTELRMYRKNAMKSVKDCIRLLECKRAAES